MFRRKGNEAGLMTQIGDLKRRNDELVNQRIDEYNAVEEKVDRKIKMFVRDLQLAIMRDETNRRYIIDDLAIARSGAMTKAFRMMGIPDKPDSVPT